MESVILLLEMDLRFLPAREYQEAEDLRVFILAALCECAAYCEDAIDSREGLRQEVRAKSPTSGESMETNADH